MTTEANVEKYLGYEVPAADSTYVATLISAVETYIENYTGRQFSVDSSASARYFDGEGGREILIDHCSSITSVEFIDEDGNTDETIASGDYYTYPLNRPNSEPIFGLYFVENVIPNRKKSVKVTAKWGDYSSVPDDITYVATALVGIIYGNPSRKGIKSESIGRYSVSFGKALEDSPLLKEVLDMYRTPEVMI